MRCDQCRHWEKDEPSYRNVEGVGQCRAAVQIWDATEWTKDDDGEDFYCDRTIKPEHVGHMLFVSDGSDYRAAMWTAPEFFCAHFAPLVG